MNIFGHTYVAYKILNKLDGYVFAGSHISDIVPFVPGSTFTFEEIHESPDKLLDFIKANYPGKEDLALSMMTHSVKFGADKFNREIDNWLLRDSEELLDEITEKIIWCSGVSMDVAKGPRIHNYLWCGIDLFILKNKPEFVLKFVESSSQINRPAISKILSKCFNKEYEKVLRDLNYIFDEVDPKYLTSVSGLAILWRKFLAGLPEKDDVDPKRAEEVFDFIYEKFKGNWEDVLDNVISDVEKRMKDFL